MAKRRIGDLSIVEAGRIVPLGASLTLYLEIKSENVRLEIGA